MNGSRAGLALFGGSFNPPHRTHRRIVERALAELEVEELWVIPAGEHPHKGEPDHGMAPAEHRLGMCRLQFRDLEEVVVSDREIRRSGKSYTVETLSRLRAERPATALFFLIGSDNLPLLPTWREHHRILDLCTVVTFPRAGHPVDEESLVGLDLTAAERQHLLAHVLEMEPDAVNATELRERLRSGDRGLAELDPAVEDYIRRHHLYGC